MAPEETGGSGRVTGAAPQLLPSRAEGSAEGPQPGLRDANVPVGFPRLEPRNNIAPEASGDAPSSTVDPVSTAEQSYSVPPFSSPEPRWARPPTSSFPRGLLAWQQEDRNQVIQET